MSRYDQRKKSRRTLEALLRRCDKHLDKQSRKRNLELAYKTHGVAATKSGSLALPFGSAKPKGAQPPPPKQAAPAKPKQAAKAQTPAPAAAAASSSAKPKALASPPARAPPSAETMERLRATPCTKFAAGACQRGAECWFSHTIAAAPQKATAVNGATAKTKAATPPKRAMATMMAAAAAASLGGAAGADVQWAVDSAAFGDLRSRDSLPHGTHVVPAHQEFITALGHCVIEEQCSLPVIPGVLTAEPFLFPQSCPPVLSQGKRIEEGWSSSWGCSRRPFMLSAESNFVPLDTIDRVPHTMRIFHAWCQRV